MNDHDGQHAGPPQSRLLRPWAWPLFAAATAAIIALFPMPYGYFEFLRWTVCAAAIYVCTLAYRRRAYGWLLIGVPLIVLFSPARFLYFEVGVWKAIDLAAAIALVGAALLMRDENREDQTAQGTSSLG